MREHGQVLKEIRLNVPASIVVNNMPHKGNYTPRKSRDLSKK